VPGWLFGSLRGYRPAWLRGDVLAGLTVWAVLVPESLASGRADRAG
jgi:MFS superfamily sulfate permease-like transporter